MSFLINIINQRPFKELEVSKVVNTLYQKIKWLRVSQDRLNIKNIIIYLENISKIIEQLKKSLDKFNYDVSDKLCISFEPDIDVGDILYRIDNKCKNVNLNINLSEALEELYKNMEIMESYRLLSEDKDFVLNIIHEIYLNLSQHFLYHMNEIRTELSPTP
ncbi:MAG: hypothetical protein WC862_03960 [Patescibacteria group bacterium]